MSQRREFAVDPADRCSPGRRRTGRRRQAWRALTRGRPASACGVQRQREDDARDEDGGSRGRPGDPPLRRNRAQSGFDGARPARDRAGLWLAASADRPAVPIGRPRESPGWPRRPRPARRLAQRNELVDALGVSASGGLAFPFRGDRTVPAVRRSDASRVSRRHNRFVGRRSIRDQVAQQVPRLRGSVRPSGRFRLAGLSRTPLLAPPAALLELVDVLTGS
jgi:hypothetical protein